MRGYKQHILKTLQKFDIYVYRAAHESHFTLRKRIESELIKQANGVLHIGAHEGQEAFFYDQCGAKVLWVEANPSAYEILLENIRQYPSQSATRALLGAENDTHVNFNLASNRGASSSIYVPNPEFEHPFNVANTISLEMSRLDSIISEKVISQFPHWVVDVQGAELPVLSGAGSFIRYCNSMVVEAKNKSYYSGGTSYPELREFLRREGFTPLWEIDENGEDNIFFLRIEGRLK